MLDTSRNSERNSIELEDNGTTISLRRDHFGVYICIETPSERGRLSQRDQACIRLQTEEAEQVAAAITEVIYGVG